MSRPCAITSGASVATDATGKRYIACAVARESVDEYLDRMRHLVGDERFRILRDAQQSRDSGGFHITLVTPPEMLTLPEARSAAFLASAMSYTLIDLGRCRRGVNEAWFVIIESADATQLRLTAKLPPKDLHITIGFFPDDVHDAPKDLRALVRPLRRLVTGKIEG